MRPEQLQALGLELPPFEQGPAGKFFFSTPALTQRLDLLHHLVQYSDLLLVVTAPDGGGKTSVLAKALEGAGPNWRLCPISIVSAMGVNALLDRVMTGLDVPGGGARDEPPEARLARLAGHLEALVGAGDLAAIFIDDAEAIEDDALELVIQLAIRSPNLKARIVLSGSSALGQRVQSLAQRDQANELVHVLELPAFSEEHTGDYLHTRLRVAGMVGDSPFTPSTVADIRRESKGRPGRINELALQELSNLAERRSDAANRSRVTGLLLHWWKGVAVVAVALLLLAVAIVVLPSRAPTQGRAAPPPQIVDIANPPKIQTDPTLVILGDPVPVPVPVPVPAGGGPGSASTPPGPDELGDVPDQQPEAAPDGAEKVPPGTSTGRPRDTLVARPADRLQPPAVDSEKLPTPASPSPNAVTVIENELVPAAAGSANEAKSAATPAAVASDAASGEESAVNPAPATALTPAVSGKTTGAGPIRTATWLRAQPPDNFTIQLLGTHDAQAMYRFIRRSRIGKAGAWFRTTHQNKPWYVVVYGSYPNRTAARAAAADLPGGIAVKKPWIRSISSVIAVLR